MDAIIRKQLERQLARAIEIGDRLAVTVLRAKLAPRPPEMSELEKRFAWGDR